MNAAQNCFTFLFCIGGLVLVSFVGSWMLGALSRGSSSRPTRNYIHPTARVEGCAVIVSGNVFTLQNNMFRYVSGGVWTHLRSGEWKFEHPQINPRHLADTINHNSNEL